MAVLAPPSTKAEEGRLESAWELVGNWLGDGWELVASGLVAD